MGRRGGCALALTVEAAGEEAVALCGTAAAMPLRAASTSPPRAGRPPTPGWRRACLSTRPSSSRRRRSWGTQCGTRLAGAGLAGVRRHSKAGVQCTQVVVPHWVPHERVHDLGGFAAKQQRSQRWGGGTDPQTPLQTPCPPRAPGVCARAEGALVAERHGAHRHELPCAVRRAATCAHARGRSLNACMRASWPRPGLACNGGRRPVAAVTVG
jgi:hypothetical protein